MNFEFFRLANVEENSVVTEDTFSLVVNGDDVQKTKSTLLNSKFYKDFTDEYEEWASQQQSTQRKDIETFVKTLVAIDGVPYVGYIDSLTEGTAMFEVFGNNTDSKQHLEVFYKSTVSGQVVKNLKVCNFYNSITISSDTYSIINGQLRHSDGSHDIIVNNISNRGDMENIGNAYIDGNVHADGYISSDSSIITHGTNTNAISIDGNKIDLYNNNTGISLSHNNDECLTVSGSGGDSIEIKNVSNPTLNKSAANKYYVDNKVTQLNGRIDNLIIGGDSTEGEEIVVDIINNVQIYENTARSLIALSGENTKLITVVWSCHSTGSNANVWHTENVEYVNATGDGIHYNLVAYNLNDFYVGSSYAMFMVIYSRKANLIVPELVDLRQPFYYTGTWPPAEYDPTSQGYVYGEYVTYNDVIYMCIDEQGLVSGQWDPDYWTPVTARLNIQNALDDTLRADGSIPMTGNLNLNGTNKIINLATPTSGTDAANKNYVDSKGFSLDANGILSFG